MPLRTKLAFLSIVSLLTPLSLQAATSKKDPSAITIVKAAITAMGGDVAILQIKDSVVTGTIAPATKDSWVKPGSFTWKTLGTEFRYETQREMSTQVLASGHGKPAVSRNGKIAPLFNHVAEAAVPFHLPFLVLLPKISDPTYSLTDAGSKILSTKAAFAAQSNFNPNDASVGNITPTVSQETWYVDQTTGFLLRVDYRVPQTDNMNNWIDAAMEFSDFRQINGVFVPYALTYYESGVAIANITVASVAFNVGLDPTEFDLLGGVQ